MPARRNPRIGAEGLWIKRYQETGKKVKSATHGQGRCWGAPWVEASGREREKLFARKVDAEKHLENVTVSVVTDQYVASEGGNALASEVLKKYLAVLDLKRSTRVGYRSAVDAHIWPRWGNTPLEAVQVSYLRAWPVAIQAGNPGGEIKGERDGVGAGYARKVGRGSAWPWTLLSTTGSSPAIR